MNDLKPCPFCGGEAFRDSSADCTGTPMVGCMDCSAHVVARTEMEAGNAWNCRALPAVSQPEAEPVAWHTDDNLEDRSATTWDKSVAERWKAKGWPVTPLYTCPTPAPVVPAEGPISTLEMVYRNMPDIPELPEAYQPRNIARSLAALRSAPPVVARVKPLVWEDQTCGSYCWVQGLHYYTEGSDEDRDWYVSCMIDGVDVWQGENQPTRGECKALAQADYEARILSALEGK